MKKWLRRIPVLVVLLLVVGWLAYSFQPVPALVEVAKARQGRLQVTVNEDGKTRVRQEYIVSAPVYGKLFRITLNEGDEVSRETTILARVQPSDPDLLDARAQAEAEARVKAAEAYVEQVKASLQRAKQAHELARTEFARAEQLKQRGTLTPSEFDAAKHKERMADADVNSAEFAVSVATFELRLAETALLSTQPQGDSESPATTIAITSPIDGRVFRVLREQAGVVSPGTELMEIGDPRDLEMEIDVLSTDAVKIEPGTKVWVEHWGGSGMLEGVVRLVEPSAFLKISALGVEEQRVNVIADFTTPYADRQSLGDGFRIEARILVDEVNDAIIVPSGTLFRHQGKWHVFVAKAGQAHLTPVSVGLSNGQETVITKGLAADDVLIMHPNDTIAQGTLVRWE